MNDQIKGFRENLRQTQRGLGWYQKNDMQCCGVTMAQCHTLLEIGERGDISIVELAAILGIDTSTLSRNVDTMFKSGLVNRVLNPNDRRYVTISLTEKGQSLFTTIQSAFDVYIEKLFEFIPGDKHLEVIESLSILASAIDKCNKGFPCCSNLAAEGER
jgi:DNA-binding MarR family transcriptional regulator